MKPGVKITHPWNTFPQVELFVEADSSSLSGLYKKLSFIYYWFDILGVKVSLLDINGVREWTLKYIDSKFDLQIVLTTCEQ